MSKHDTEKSEKAEKRRGGRLFSKLFLFLGTTALLVALVFLVIPRDMSEIEGAGPAAVVAPKKDIRAMLLASKERGHEVSFTEEEINGYLFRTLQSEQKGMFGSHAKLEGVWVNLEDGQAELIMERTLYGKSITLSVFLQIEQTVDVKENVSTTVVLHGGPYFANGYPNRGGRFGSLVVPQGFLLLVQPSFEKLAEVYREEIETISKMARIRIEKGRVVLNPEPPSSNLMGGEVTE